MNNYILLILDSCRYDTMNHVWNDLEYIPKIGGLQKAYSLSTWTLTSHIAFAIGRIPWIDYRTDLDVQKQDRTDPRDWDKKLDVPISLYLTDDFDFKSTLHRFGYTMKAITSARPVEPQSPLKYLVDTIISVGNKGDTLERIIEQIDCSNPSFFILNTYETHFPYFDGAYDPSLNDYYIGGYRSQINAAREGRRIRLPLFSEEYLKLLFERQCSAIRYVDNLIPRLLGRFPKNTFITITSDHGDCFGEDGFVGHAEVSHKKVLEVPLIEGMIRF